MENIQKVSENTKFASINVKIEQEGFNFENKVIQIRDITFKQGFNFVAKTMHKYLVLQRLLKNSKNRPKLSKEFSITIETSDGQTFAQTTKIQLPTNLTKVPKFEEKLLKVVGITVLNERDDNYWENAFLITEGHNPNFPLVIAESE